MSGAGEPLIRISGVSVAYPVPGGRVQALSDVSLEIRRGEWLTVIGHNGSGKSTLAKLCNGLVLPGRGEVTVDGLSTRDEEQRRRIRQLVGIVFQDPEDGAAGHRHRHRDPGGAEALPRRLGGAARHGGGAGAAPR